MSIDPMNEYLRKLGFENWIRVEENPEKFAEIVKKLPKRTGVYVIRANRTIARLKGESSILYVGQGVIKHRIESHFKYFLPPRFKKWITIKDVTREELWRVHKELSLNLEFSYILCAGDEAKRIESMILREYRYYHIEAPPLNYTRE